jgi:putative ABC transport system permease protein
MSFALSTLWFEKGRYLPGVLAVTFSAVLIAIQGGLLYGLFSITSLPIDESNADVWVGPPNVPSVDLARSFPADWIGYLSMPGVVQMEEFIQGFAHWDKPNGGTELCVIIGANLAPDSLGAAKGLTPRQRALLTEPGAVIIDASEFSRLGVTKVGDWTEVNGRRVRVVDTITGFKSLAGPFVFCSVPTSRVLLRLRQDETFFLLAKCSSPEAAKEVVAKLQANPKISAFTTAAFSLRTRMHWLTKTRAGIALGFAALLGLVVGCIVTGQTLFSATAASLKEYAVLRALGIPRWRMAQSVLTQALGVGIFGILLAFPTIYLMAGVVTEVGGKVQLPTELIAFAMTVTLTMALLSGLAALRLLWRVEPVTLLR